MADENERLSPEEKLLKVMQGNDQEPDVSDADASVAEDAALPADPPEETPSRLKVADRPGEKQAGDEPGSGTDASRRDAGDESGEAVSGDTPREARFGAKPGAARGRVLRQISRVLGVVIVLLIAFAAIEVWAHVQKTLGLMRPTLSAGEGDAVAVPEFARGDPVSLPRLLEAFKERPILTGLEVEPVTTTGTTVVDPAWVREVRSRYDLIGTSTVPGSEGALEAIVVDKENNKMHFLQVGQSLSVAKRDFEVVDIGDGRLKLRHGEKDVDIE